MLVFLDSLGLLALVDMLSNMGFIIINAPNNENT